MTTIPKYSREYLWDEYKVLQEKLDKIGDYRFRVKTWFVTVLAGLLFAGSAVGSNWATAVAALLVTLAFVIMEYHHVHWQRALQGRAYDIEQLLYSRGVHDKVKRRSPQIVEAILAANERLYRPRPIRQTFARMQAASRRAYRDIGAGHLVSVITRNSVFAFYFLCLGAAITVTICAHAHLSHNGLIFLNRCRLKLRRQSWLSL